MKKAFLYIFILPGIVAVLVSFVLSLKSAGPTFADATPSQVVELKNGEVYTLTAKYVMKDIGGAKVPMLAYNGSVPGPTFKVKQGDTATIRFKNETGMETLLHSHGVRAENAYDGSHLVQAPMKDGETFDYKLTFPDTGAFIYHPHVREDLQQDLGLYGNFIVTPRDPAYWPPVNKEETLVLDDVLIEDGALAPHSPNYATHALMGRFGNTMLVSGETALTRTAMAGEVVRYYVTNVANTRTFALTLPGATMKLVGGDNGRYEKETFVEKIVLSPSERAIIDVLWDLPKPYVFTHNPGNGEKTYPLATIDVKQVVGTTTVQSFVNAFQTLRKTDAYAASLDEFRSYLDDEPTKLLTMTVKVDMDKIMSQMGGAAGGAASGGHDHGAMAAGGASGAMVHNHPAVPIEWEDLMGTMNVFSTDKTTTWVLRDMTGVDTTTTTPAVLPRDNMDVNWKFEVGDLVKIRIFNDPKSPHPMQHPFHMHGQKFLVLATNGTPTENLVWKDTTLVQMGDTVDVLVPMENVGKWMAHCHIAEHLTSGMMIGFEVRPKAGE
jgi:suppressor of ftsI